MKNLQHKTLSAIKWSGLAQLLRQLLQFAISVMLARLLNPQEFGLIGMILVFTGFVNIFGDLGLGAALIQRSKLEPRHLNTVFWLNIATGLLLTGAFIIAAPVIAKFYGEPALYSITMVIALNFFIGSFHYVPNSIFQKNMDFRRLAQIEIIALILSGVVAINMAFFGLGIWSLVAQTLILTLVTVILIWRFSSWRPSFSWDKKAFKELAGFSSNLTGYNIFNYWARNFDNLLIGKYIGSAALGIYARAYSLMLLPLSQIASVVSKVMFPALASIQDDITRVKKVYLRLNRTVALITFPMMIGLFVVADSFIHVVYGAKWQAVIPLLKIFCLVSLEQSIGAGVGLIFNSQGRTDIQFRLSIFSGVVRAIAFIIGLRWGIIGVAIAYAFVEYVILWYPGWAIPGRLINLRFSEMLKNVAGIFCCAIIMGVFTGSIKFLMPMGWSHLAYLSIQIPSAIVIYALLLCLFKIKTLHEVLELIFSQLKTGKKRTFNFERQRNENLTLSGHLAESN